MFEFRPEWRSAALEQHLADVEAVVGHQAARGAGGVVGVIHHGRAHDVAPFLLLGTECDAGAQHLHQRKARVTDGFDHDLRHIYWIGYVTLGTSDLQRAARFYDAIVSGKGEFINGVRLVYPMEKEAMRTLNFIGNKLFSMSFSWLLGQPIKDTLCGTKVMWREDYEKIAANRSYFGDFDPFGDFDLIFGAAKLNRKIIDLPIRYRERTYGTTNISRWKHGLLLLRMVAFAARRIKFV